MKKLTLLLAILGLGAGCSALAQTPGQVTQGPGNTAGILWASNFGQWAVPQGNTGQFSWSVPSQCNATASGIPLNPVFKVGTPITIKDQVPANTEIVTPSAVYTSNSSCSITVSPVHQHNTFTLTSATAGLQEAINYAAGLPYEVILTPDWSRLGGTTGMITAATGSAAVSIEDARGACLVAYLWSGSAYVAQPNSCGGGSGVNFGTTGQIAYYPANGTAVSGETTVPITAGGTGATTAAGAQTSLGLPVYVADVYSGDDCGAKINAAIIASGGIGTIQVGATCGNTISTTVNPTKQTVSIQFVSAGTWTLSAPIILGQDATLSSSFSSEAGSASKLYVADNYSGTCPSDPAGVAYYAAICMSIGSSVHDIEIYGTAANQINNVQGILVQNAASVKIRDTFVNGMSQDGIHITNTFYPALTAGETLSLNTIVTIFTNSGQQLFETTVAGTGSSSYPGYPIGACTAATTIGNTCTWGSAVLTNYAASYDNASSNGWVGPNVWLQFNGRDGIFTERNADWTITPNVQFEDSGRDGFHCEDCAAYRFIADDFGANGRYGFYAAVVNGQCASVRSTAGHFISGTQFGSNGYNVSSWSGAGGDIYINGSAASAIGFCASPSTYQWAGSNTIVGNQFIGPYVTPIDSIQFLDAGSNNLSSNTFGGPYFANYYNYLVTSTFSLLTGAARVPNQITATALTPTSGSLPIYQASTPYLLTSGVDYADAVISPGTRTMWGDLLVTGKVIVTNPVIVSPMPENYVLQAQSLTTSPWTASHAGAGSNPTVTACPACADPFGNTGTGVYTLVFDLNGGGTTATSFLQQVIAAPAGATSGTRKVYVQAITSGTPVLLLAGESFNCGSYTPVTQTWTQLTIYCPTSGVSDKLVIETQGTVSPDTLTLRVWDPCATYSNGQCISPTGTPTVTTTAVVDYTKYTNVDLGLLFGNAFTQTPIVINGLQGTDANLMTAGMVSGTSAPLCTDANGGATTSNCPGSGSGTGFNGGAGTSFQDALEIAAPANPASTYDRLYLDSTAHLLKCLTSSGGSCMPSGSGVNFGTTGQIAYYPANGTAVSGETTVPITAGGTGATTAAAALANLGGAALSGAAFTGPVSIASTLSVANHSAFGANAVVDTLPPLELSNYGLVPSSVNTIYENSVSGVNGITLEIGWSPSGAVILYPQAINGDSEINFDNATGVLPAVGASSFLLNLNGNTVKASEAIANSVEMNNNGNADANILIASQEYINQFGTGIIDNASGVDSGIYIKAGTITNYSAFAAGGSAYTLGGTIGEFSGFSVQDFITGVHGGTLNNVYGIKIGQLTGAVSSWGVYESGTEPNYFNGAVSEPSIVAPASSSATDSASLGPELTTSGTCTGTGWTGTYPTYTPPGTTAPLTCTGFTSGSYYQTVTTLAGNTGGGTLTIVIGTAQVATASGASGVTTAGLKANGTSLTYTPTAALNGTVTISAKLISPITTFSYQGKDSTGAVSGQMLLQGLGSLNNLFIGGGGIYNTTGSNNTANGYAALYANTTGSYNTANGYQALYANTTGSSNTANGYSALQTNTTGIHNTANGYQALYLNTTGNNNTANGMWALYSNTTGSSNTANGYEALYYNTTGNSNTANGYSAGRYIADGVTANQTSSNSVYEGYEAYPLASGDTNENVIGNAAIGHGSNTTTLGNSSVTATYLAGITLPLVIYSHAGTQLAACASGLQGGMAVVSDATALVPGTAYSVTAGAGADTVRVQCTLVSGTYAWQTM